MIKKLFPLLFSLAVAAFGANVQIRDLSTAVTLGASNTYLIADGATQGTVKTLLSTIPQITSTRTTLAALSVTGISTGVAAQTLGGSSVGDGAGALYYYNSASSATPNGTTIIQPTVGSGRWLIVLSNTLPAPTVSTLGGVFSKAGVSHQYLSALDTAGNFTLSTVTTADVSGLGTMAAQNSTAVAITGGAINGTIIGATSAVAGRFSHADAVSGGYIGVGTGGTAFASFEADTAAAAMRLLDTTSLGSSIILTTQADSVVGRNGLITSGDLHIKTGASPGTTRLKITSTGIESTVEAKLTYVIATAPIGAYNSSTGGLYMGYGSGTSILRSVADNSATAAPISVQVGNGTQVANFTTTGLNSADVGQTVPGKITGTAIGTTTILNVRLFGAVGNGSTNDATAINAAFAAAAVIGNHVTVYFPPGKYRITSGLSGFTGMSYLTVTGNGAEIYNDSGSTGSTTMAFDSTCSHVEVYGLSFTGTASVRGNGVHIRMYASNSSVHDNYLSGCSDFAIHVGSAAGTTYSSNVVVADNVIFAPLGDGIHVGSAKNVSVTGNVVVNSGDDSIAVIADDAAFPPMQVTVSGNTITNSAFRGIAILECYDVVAEGNNITTTVASAIEVGRYLSTAAYNTRIQVNGNKINNSTTSSGPRGAIWLNFVANCVASDNQISGVVNGSGICYLDVADLTIANNTIYSSASRGIASDDTTTANVASAWGLLTITGNNIQYNVSNEAIYVVPASGKTINNLVVTSNTCQSTASGNWIYYDRISTGKVGNNTNRDGLAVTAGGSVTSVVAFNNN